MTTCDRSQCPELTSNYDNGRCPRVKFVYYVNKYLLVASFKLEAAEIIRNSVTKDTFFYVPTPKIFNIYFSLMYTVKPISSKQYEIRVATPLQYHASSKEAKLFLQSHGIGVHHIPRPLVV